MALDGLTFTVPDGVVFGLLGPNGSGKTTAMRAILGLVSLDGGSISWDGRPIGFEDRRRIGYLPEERGLYPAMRVADQLRYLARLHGMTKAEATGAAKSWLVRLGIEDRGNSRVDHLSLGNQQRVQLAATLIFDPEILVLDEPFSGLDPGGVDEVTEILLEYASAGKTVLLSSHQLDLVEDVCQSAVIVSAGKAVALGEVDALTGAGRRRLAVRVRGDFDGKWTKDLAGVRISENAGGTLRLVLEAGTDPGAVLNAALAAGPVEHFALERRRMSEVFREAVAASPGAPAEP